MDNDLEMAALGLNGCEGCQHCVYAGIRWPASPDGCEDLSYVDRCDYCEIYDSDEDAAKALAKHLDVRWGYAYREIEDYSDNPRPESTIRWEPEQDDGLDYTGWSCFIDHEARDGDPKYHRDGNWVTLELNPGEARIVHEALQELGTSMASEWKHGELFAIVERMTIDRLYEDLGKRLHAPDNTYDKETS
jgi:hypothetical protein